MAPHTQLAGFCPSLTNETLVEFACQWAALTLPKSSLLLHKASWGELWGTECESQCGFADSTHQVWCSLVCVCVCMEGREGKGKTSSVDSCERSRGSLDEHPPPLGPWPGSGGGGDAVKRLTPSPRYGCSSRSALTGICLNKRGCFAPIGC